MRTGEAHWGARCLHHLPPMGTDTLFRIPRRGPAPRARDRDAVLRPRARPSGRALPGVEPDSRRLSCTDPPADIVREGDDRRSLGHRAREVRRRPGPPAGARRDLRR
jgi:hypothetical protein